MNTNEALPELPYNWQHAQWQHIQKLVESKRTPHALMLSGSSDIGKLRFARALAQLLLCETPVADGACGRCKQCLLFASGSHPDLLLLEPEAEGRAIKVDQIRKVDDFVAKTSQQGGWKVVIIQPAEAMNINAANALLKNLEEPGERTLLILVSPVLEQIPATVRSRCQILKFPRPEYSKVSSWLEQVAGADEDINGLLQKANGRPLLALRFLQTGILTKQAEFEALVDQVARGETSSLKAANWCKAEDALQVIGWFQNYTGDLLKQGGEGSFQRLLYRFVDRLLVAKRLLQGPSNPNLQLLWEELLMDWQALSSIADKR